MKISGQDPSLASAYLRNLGNNAQKPSPPTAGSSGTAASTEEKVVISDAARAIQEASGNKTDMDGVRTEKVEALKNQVESGTYKIDPQKVAEKMIKESLLNDLL
jgi:negative regulator of flagellin synthesis FlgM